MNALAPALNTMPFASVLSERETPVVLEDANVAVSDGLLGTVRGIQLFAVFQSPVAGLAFHVALPAWLGWMVSSNSKADSSAARNAVLNTGRSAPVLEVVSLVFIGLFSR